MRASNHVIPARDAPVVIARQSLVVNGIGNWRLKLGFRDVRCRVLMASLQVPDEALGQFQTILGPRGFFRPARVPSPGHQQRGVSSIVPQVATVRRPRRALRLRSRVGNWKIHPNTRRLKPPRMTNVSQGRVGMRERPGMPEKGGGRCGASSYLPWCWRPSPYRRQRNRPSSNTTGTASRSSLRAGPGRGHSPGGLARAPGGDAEKYPGRASLSGLAWHPGRPVMPEAAAATSLPLPSFAVAITSLCTSVPAGFFGMVRIGPGA